MRVFRGLPNAESRSPCALTLGNFDGVHLGHRALLRRARAAADARGLPLCVMTFEPHPREFFSPEGAPPRIALLRDKLEALSVNQVDRVVVEHFNRTFAAQPPDDFIRNVIVNGLHARWVLVGDDFRYGAKRAGDFNTLRAAGDRYGFEVERMDTIADEFGARVSSSAVRAALRSGDLAAARTLLGRDYAITGHVVHGAKLGRDLGFPTLNVRIPHKRPALAGILIVRVHGLAEHPLPGVASLGLRPTVDDSGRTLLEVHLLDWAGDAYGKVVSVEFLEKLRDEERYVDIASLTSAIGRDVARAKAYFASPNSRGFATAATDRI
ncbi:MAG: bifunctional riboflavin kinase/FAD synthetase [Janthinobacterium lividum]